MVKITSGEYPVEVEREGERPKPTPRPPNKPSIQIGIQTQPGSRQLLAYIDKINETLRVLLEVEKAIGLTLPDDDIKKAICALAKIQAILFSQSSTSRLTVKETEQP